MTVIGLFYREYGGRPPPRGVRPMEGALQAAHVKTQERTWLLQETAVRCAPDGCDRAWHDSDTTGPPGPRNGRCQWRMRRQMAEVPATPGMKVPEGTRETTRSGSGVTAAGSRAARSGTGPAHADADCRVLGGLGAPGHLPDLSAGSRPGAGGDRPGHLGRVPWPTTRPGCSWHSTGLRSSAVAADRGITWGPAMNRGTIDGHNVTCSSTCTKTPVSEQDQGRWNGPGPVRVS